MVQENHPWWEQGALHKIFAGLSDEDFALWMSKLASGSERVVLYAPNFAEGENASIDVQRNIKIARKRFGHEFWQRIWRHPENKSEPAYLTNNPFMIVELPVRRQASALDEKISVPERSPLGRCPDRSALWQLRNARVSLSRTLGAALHGHGQVPRRAHQVPGWRHRRLQRVHQIHERARRCRHEDLVHVRLGVESSSTLLSLPHGHAPEKHLGMIILPNSEEGKRVSKELAWPILGASPALTSFAAR